MHTAFLSGYGLSIAIRVAAVAFTLVCIFFLPPLVVMFLFIVLGLAHFSLAFWYQKGAGRWKWRATVFLLFTFVVIASVIMFAGTALFFVITGIYTSLHMAWDEVHLLKGEHSLFSTLELTPFVVLYGSLLVDVNFGTALFVPALLVAAAALLGYALLSVVHRRMPGKVSFVNLGWGAFALIVYGAFLTTTGFPAYLWFLGLAVVHYLIWYGEYARKVAGNPERQKTYYGRVIAVNMLLFGGLWLWWEGWFVAGNILYLPVFFYVWAFLHVTTSTRPSDVSKMFSLP